MTRRHLIELGSLAYLGLSLPQWLRAKRSSSSTSCIFIWLDGGPSHIDTFDPKPDAPREVRGTFSAIDTTAHGVRICEHLPRIAKQMHRTALIRTLTSGVGEHDQAGHYFNTGFKVTPSQAYPSFGSVISKSAASNGALPAYVALPDPRPYMGSGYLAGSHAPFALTEDAKKRQFRVRDLDFPVGLDEARLGRRRAMVEALDDFDRAHQDHAGSIDRDEFFEQAYRLITTPEAKQAFDLGCEPEGVRERYGRHRLGRGCLLARRLVEGGAKFVTVLDRGWDTHLQIDYNLTYGFPGKLPGLDQAYSALIEDLGQRGMLESTLVVLMGEFGRTPKINPGGGRDHWPRANSALLAGAGIAGGQVIGETDAVGEAPKVDPVTPEDFARTLYRLLHVDPDQTLHTPDGRPIPLVAGGRVIPQIVAS